MRAGPVERAHVHGFRERLAGPHREAAGLELGESLRGVADLFGQDRWVTLDVLLEDGERAGTLEGRSSGDEVKEERAEGVELLEGAD